MSIILLFIYLSPGWWGYAGVEMPLPEPEPEPEIVLSDYDIKLMARLGVVECRGMGDAVEDCTRSVVSTVLRRIEFYEETRGAFGLSDGTVAGTLYNHDLDNWQFPPWVVGGCEFVSEEACLDWVDLIPFIGYVEAYLEDGEAPCDGYLYYDSLPGGNSECKVETPHGWIEFHQGWGWEPKTE